MTAFAALLLAASTALDRQAGRTDRAHTAQRPAYWASRTGALEPNEMMPTRSEESADAVASSVDRLGNVRADLDHVTRHVDWTPTDTRGWSLHHEVRYGRVSSGAETRIHLATPAQEDGAALVANVWPLQPELDAARNQLFGGSTAEQDPEAVVE